MSTGTTIEWTDATWNPVRGCTRVSEGCRNCYAEIMAARFSKPGQWGHGFATMKGGDHRWTGKLALIDDQLGLPLHWRKPRRIFVNSTSDLFHENLPDEAIDKVFAVMALCPQHTFQVLTKRPERMRRYLSSDDRAANVRDWLNDQGPQLGLTDAQIVAACAGVSSGPLPNVWLGVSVEDQRHANERVHELLWTPAAKRFVSAEPLLGPVDLTRLNNMDTVAHDALRGIRVKPPLGEPIDPTPANRLDWVIVGGESGSDARPMHPQWARALRDQCAAAGVPFFFKQWGEWIGAGQTVEGQPPDRAYHRWPDGAISARVGKKAAGALLDGREHREFPA
jgi:protein gp37